MAQRKAIIPSSLKGVFVGSGSDGLTQPAVRDAILQLTGKLHPFPVVNGVQKVALAQEINVAYLGTATYDLPIPRFRQTHLLAEAGCNIIDIRVGDPSLTPTPSMMEWIRSSIRIADVVLVSGGNTLFAIQRWNHLGIDAMIAEARDRGCVLAGGSAGAICWFQSGHSDSMDPDTYRAPMILEARAAAAPPTTSSPSGSSAVKQDESSTLGATKKSWKYIRVRGLGFLPGMLGPHYDRTQSNGLPRHLDFDQMLLRHPTEIGIGIDHWAALVVDGDQYSVLSIPGKRRGPAPVAAAPGESSPGAEITEAELPGVWFKQVQPSASEGGAQEIITTRLPATGRLSDFLVETPDSVLVADPLELQCLSENPVVSS